jgi:surfactin family lipopeptide synthetase B/lichenysin synthetase B
MENYKERSGLINRYEEPGDYYERILAGIWEDLLGIRPIGINDDFFELGGQSLNGVLMISNIHK